MEGFPDSPLPPGLPFPHDMRLRPGPGPNGAPEFVPGPGGRISPLRHEYFHEAAAGGWPGAPPGHPGPGQEYHGNMVAYPHPHGFRPEFCEGPGGEAMMERIGMDPRMSPHPGMPPRPPHHPMMARGGQLVVGGAVVGQWNANMGQRPTHNMHNFGPRFGGQQNSFGPRFGGQQMKQQQQKKKNKKVYEKLHKRGRVGAATSQLPDSRSGPKPVVSGVKYCTVCCSGFSAGGKICEAFQAHSCIIWALRIQKNVTFT